MKKLMITLFALLSVTVYGQEPVLTYKGDLYFIPGSMTKAGEAFMMSANYNENSVRTYTIYDGDFKVVKSFTDPTIGIPYQLREVRMSYEHRGLVLVSRNKETTKLNLKQKWTMKKWKNFSAR